VRGLAALLGRGDPDPALQLIIATEGGTKRVTRITHEGPYQTFRASMGTPSELRQQSVVVEGETMSLVVLNIGNPHAVLLGPLPDDTRLARIGAALERHSMFPDRTNVEFAEVEAPSRVRIRIWERGAGATRSSGTGSCAALIAAAQFGGAERDAEIIAPGGAQRVEWRDDGVYLTGSAEVLCAGEWLRRVPVVPT
jgi:diaminopimelate epimerase